MPDKRLRGATQYSTHPATQRVRQRLARMNPNERAVEDARRYEYNAVWSLFNRLSKKDAYRRRTVTARRSLLSNEATALMSKRRQKGSVMSNIDIDEMIDRHLKKEADERAAQRTHTGPRLNLKGVAVDPTEDNEQQQLIDEDQAWDVDGPHQSGSLFPQTSMRNDGHGNEIHASPSLGDFDSPEYYDPGNESQLPPSLSSHLTRRHGSAERGLYDVEQGLSHVIRQHAHIQHQIEQNSFQLQSLTDHLIMRQLIPPEVGQVASRSSVLDRTQWHQRFGGSHFSHSPMAPAAPMHAHLSGTSRNTCDEQVFRDPDLCNPAYHTQMSPATLHPLAMHGPRGDPMDGGLYEYSIAHDSELQQQTPFSHHPGLCGQSFDFTTDQANHPVVPQGHPHPPEVSSSVATANIGMLTQAALTSPEESLHCPHGSSTSRAHAESHVENQDRVLDEVRP